MQVEYLHFVGDFTLLDAVKYCMKEAMTDDTVRHFSAWVERGNLPLFETNLIKVIYLVSYFRLLNILHVQN